MLLHHTSLRTLIITEIIDPVLPIGNIYIELSIPRFVELYAPIINDRSLNIADNNLKLVIYPGNAQDPDWGSAIALNDIPSDGFIVVCNSQANIYWQGKCTTVIDSVSGPTNSNGTDKVAVISGTGTNILDYAMMDIFGELGVFAGKIISRWVLFLGFHKLHCNISTNMVYQ